MMVRGVFLLALAAAFWVGGTEARAQSFDCYEAGTPVEHLICNDSVLRDLDSRMGEVYAAQRARGGEDLKRSQRAWVTRRLGQCGIPAKGGLPAAAERWRATPCLVDMYRARLAELGSPSPAQPQPAAVSTPDFIHPLCLMDLIGFEPDVPPVPVAACNRGNAHVPVEIKDGTLSATGASEGSLVYLAYQPIGALPDKRQALLVHWNGGGSGLFSLVGAVRRAAGSRGESVISMDTVVGGGDRCMGGLSDASLQGSRLTVDSFVTPADFLMAVTGAEDVDATVCAACCFATVKIAYDLGVSDPSGRILSAKIEAPELDAASKGDRCLQKALPSLAEGQVLDKPALDAVAAKLKACLN